MPESRARGSVDRALASGARGRRFESCRARHYAHSDIFTGSFIMWLHVPKVLSPEQLQQVQACAQEGDYADGRSSAGLLAGAVKHNEELQPSSARVTEAEQCVAQAVQRHVAVQRSALPLRISHPVFARYGEGMGYGWHTDDAIMGHGGYRADLAMTVFLNDPEEYDGGDLVVRMPHGECHARHPAGDAVLYSASCLHRVELVSRGERRVAVLWIQSQVRDEQQREVLQEIDALRTQQLQDNQNATQLDWVYSRLLRMWADV